MPNFAHFVVNDVILPKRPYISFFSGQRPRYLCRIGEDMRRLFKAVLYLGVFGFIALVAYAYLGPFFGADFSAPQVEVREPVILNAD